MIKGSRSGARSIFKQCTVGLPGILWRLAKGRGTFRAQPYGEHMWAQENKLLRDRTPSATASWFSLLIRSARHIHCMWTSSKRKEKNKYTAQMEKAVGQKRNLADKLSRIRCDFTLSLCVFALKCLELFKAAIKFQGHRCSRKEAHCRLLITHNHRVQVFLFIRS